MKAVIIIAISVIVVILILVGIIALIGSRLPKAHVASRSILLHQSRTNIYATIRDFAAASSWRTDVKSIELLEPVGNKVRFREHGSNGDVTYEVDEDVAGQRLVTRIVDTDLGYSGRWVYQLADENNGTRLTITEEGEVSNVFFRFMSRYIFGHTATIDSYLTALAARFGETATPQ
jgi:hypothetical protein